jgi:hypothetical protein
MYQAAEEQINRGLSLGARLTLGFFSASFGIVMLLVAPPTDKAVFFYVFGGFCMLISVACVTRGRIRQFIGSVIGLTLFITSLWYLGAELTAGKILSGSRGEPSLMNAFLFLLAFGIPGVVYAAKARFGRRKAP